MKASLEIIAKCVPSVCIALGFVAIYIFESGSGWIFVIIGAILQTLYLVGRFQKKK